MRQFALLFVLAAGVAVAAEEKKEEKKSDFEGTWVVVGVDAGGMKIPEEDLKKTPGKLTLTADKWTLKIGDMVMSGTSKVDTSKKPMEIDSTTTEGPDKGKTIMGIVEVKGDTMRACFDQTGKGRPKEFSTKDQPAYVVIEYKREKK
jgi:uncharacterized protein (TIGR03067 family)